MENSRLVFRIENSRRSQNCNDDNLNNPPNNPPMYPRRTLQPYSDYEISVNPTKFSKAEPGVEEVDDELLGNYIDRVLLSVTMKEAGEEENFGISKPETEYRIPSSKQKTAQLEKYQKCRKQDKRNKKNRRVERRPEEEMMCEEVVPSYRSLTSEEKITLPVNEFRKMVNSEIESRAARIHSFYQCQWDMSQKDRIEAYRQVIWWKENFQKTEYMYLRAETELNKIQTAYDILQKELTNIKEAKRKRRNAAKCRRNSRDTNNNENDENQPYLGPRTAGR